MTERTAIERLDYSKPPPGYHVWRGGWSPPIGKERTGDTDQLSAAWAHYKAHNDPPGLKTWRVRDADTEQQVEPPLWGWTIADHDDDHELNTEQQQEAVEARIVDTQPGARAAAWAWHDRRLALAARIEFGDLPDHADEALDDGVDDGSIGPPWPRFLTWTDEQVAEVEHWLQDSTAEMPEVLR